MTDYAWIRTFLKSYLDDPVFKLGPVEEFHDLTNILPPMSTFCELVNEMEDFIQSNEDITLLVWFLRNFIFHQF